MTAIACGLFVSVLALGANPVSDTETVLLSFTQTLPAPMQQRDSEAKMVKHKGHRVMQVMFHAVDWPNVFFTPAEGAWDWNAYTGIAIDLFNPEKQAVDACVRVDDDASADGVVHCNTGSVSVPAKQHATLEILFNTGDRELFWGMRGVPVRGPVGSGAVLDLKHIVAFQVFLPRPISPRKLLIEQVRLTGKGGSPKDLVKFPFIDRLGQYKNADWPGKVHSEEELKSRGEEETRAITAAPALSDRDKFGGWAKGPQLTATGWFRTEKVDGKWWLVTPEGRLFFSMGIDCVGTGEVTFVDGRDGWFEGLPSKDDPQYKDMFGQVSGAHSMAERIGGKGSTFSFYRANLLRKYGADWTEKWRESVYPRLQAWGFNTIGNWSQGDVLEHSPMPFVATTGIGGNVREIEGAKGYWGRMKDVYDPNFAKVADESAAPRIKQFAENPLCIGYFVDNELSWETIREGTLASPPDQPCRKAQVEMLDSKYGSLEKLNAAWGTEAKDWDSLRVPEKRTDACDADLDAFVYQFARKYFETVNETIKRYAPHHLYLGCRFSSTPRMAVRACADVADVVSYNLYYRGIPCDKFSGANDLGKPIIIGEFHFGALDRGMFHRGLVSTKDQNDRAAHYVKYLESVADCPAFVGCHWFQFVDEPTTGRWFDGENYNIGFLTVTDTPYPELVDAAKKVHAEVYKRRYGRAK